MKRIEVLKDYIKYVHYMFKLQGLTLRAEYDESANREIVSLNKEMTEWLDEEV